MNLTLTLLALTALLAAILLGWYLRVDRRSLTDAAEWVMTLYVAGGPIALAWLLRVGVFVAWRW